MLRSAASQRARSAPISRMLASSSSLSAVVLKTP